jgi:hypothetical protein
MLRKGCLYRKLQSSSVLRSVKLQAFGLFACMIGVVEIKMIDEGDFLGTNVLLYGASFVYCVKSSYLYMSLSLR